jgi:hypothetical protein
VRVTARLGRGWCGEVETPDGIFSWEEISAVFYRRPRDFDMPSAMSRPEQRFARAQARIGLGGVLASLPVNGSITLRHWLIASTNRGILCLARTIGFRVPATLVTNVADDVRRFAAEQGDIIVKSLAEPIIAEAGSQKAIWTRRVAATELAELAGLEVTTHLFQEWIPKAHEIRLTMVGKRHFAVAIHARSAGTLVDWRTDYDALTYEVIDCPTEVAEQAHGFLPRPVSRMGRSILLSPLTPRTTYFWNATRLGSGVGLPRNVDSRPPRPSPTN